jgi:replicative DNA helicase
MIDFIDPTAEQEVIGCTLIEPDSILDVMDMLSGGDFYRPEAGKAYDGLVDACRAGEKISMVTLAKRTGVHGAFLQECVEVGYLPSTIKSAAGRVLEAAHKRRVQQECAMLQARLKEMKPEEISSKLSDIAAGISLRSSTKKVYSSEELAKRVVRLQEGRAEDPGYVRGIRTGYYQLDGCLRGLRPRRMTVIAAATGFGKSTFALNLFANVVTAGHRALYLSNENDVDDNLDRLCGIATGIDLREVEGGNAYADVTNGFEAAFWGKSMHITDNSPRNIDEVVATISRHAVQDGIELAVVDYIGEISPDASRDRENEEQRFARYAQRLVECCKSMNIHLVVLAQLNRDGNKKGKPTKAELAQCFRIAQKAHSLLLFWQTEDGKDIITVEKNRQGPAGNDIVVDFNRRNQRISERSPRAMVELDEAV